MITYLEKWQKLLAKLEVTGGDTLLGDEKGTAAFEETTQITLPAGYKEYCLIFGSGLLGDEFRIYCPSHLNERWDLFANGKWNLESFREAVQRELPYVHRGQSVLTLEQIRWLEGLLDDGFPFAENRNAEVFVWHLSSYSEKDRSYDIYRMPFDALEESGRVGRDFYEFVAKFIFETEINNFLPEDNRYHGIENTFHRVTEYD